jgi:hypothetical protein
VGRPVIQSPSLAALARRPDFSKSAEERFNVRTSPLTYNTLSKRKFRKLLQVKELPLPSREKVEENREILCGN